MRFFSDRYVDICLLISFAIFHFALRTPSIGETVRWQCADRSILDRVQNRDPSVLFENSRDSVASQLPNHIV